MQQIINFLIRNKIFLMFLLLFGIALSLTIQSHSYHRSKFVNSANFFTGGIYKTSNNVSQYFNLKEENEILIEENNQLRLLIFNKDNTTIANSKIDSTSYQGRYKIIYASVYKNSYSASNNYLTINRGKRDSIKQDFGVITSKGIVGIIDNTSNSYATVLSVLNTKSSINAKLKSSSHIGSLTWNTKSPEFVQLIHVSNFAPVTVGDTIITGGESSIFPKGIGIGTIYSFVTDISGDTYTIEVKLFNDMTSIEHVYILENLDVSEINSLQDLIDE